MIFKKPHLAIGSGMAIAAGMVAAWAIAQEQLPEQPRGAAPPPTDARHYSYAIGLDIGSSFRADRIDFDIEQLVAGINDGLKGAQPRFSQEVCGAAMQRLAAERLETLRKRNQEFLVANAKAEGVQITPSGLQYQVLKQGDGASPTLQDVVTVHYEGRMIDGGVFDGTAGGPPATMRVARVVPGWTEALQKMRVGDHWRLFIPSELAYGKEGFGNVIPPHATLIFDLQLLRIEPAGGPGERRPPN
ncbi:FKBP-type peptidyl-prolyl cis-trans isomerase [Pirellulales bacterium]|nr:FKBP-type peptidyl-prolyl cis-trans isomerase [Pirellulales bacterium]